MFITFELHIQPSATRGWQRLKWRCVRACACGAAQHLMLEARPETMSPASNYTCGGLLYVIPTAPYLIPFPGNAPLTLMAKLLQRQNVVTRESQLGQSRLCKEGLMWGLHILSSHNYGCRSIPKVLMPLLPSCNVHTISQDIANTHIEMYAY